MSFIDSNDEMGSSRFSGSKGVGLTVGGVGGVIIMLVAAYFGIDPKIVSMTEQQISQHSGHAMNSTEIQHDLAQCVHDGKIIGSRVTNTTCKIYVAVSSANTVWGNPHPEAGWTARDAQRYVHNEPDVQIFAGGVNTACGYANAQVGPFYCPGDRTAYFDKTFFEHMLSKLGASTGNLSELYVVEHEIGHHVQNIMGFRVRNHQSGSNSDSVRLELQADCFAGYWASQADKGPNPVIAPVNSQQLQEVMTTAWAIGDDTLEGQRGQVRPSTFTHGTSEQRTQWFMRGYHEGYRACNTWGVHHL